MSQTEQRDDFEELTGVGPARSERLEEAGYQRFEEVAESDAAVLSDEIDVTEDRALELVVQTTNIVEERNAEVDESPQGTVSEQIDAAGDVDGDSEEERAADDSPVTDGGDGNIDFSIEFESPEAYDAFYQTLLEQRLANRRSNRASEEFEQPLSQMRSGRPQSGVELSLSEGQLNDLHNCVRQNIIEYKGGSLIEYMEALQSVMDQIEVVRSSNLF